MTTECPHVKAFLESATKLKFTWNFDEQQADPIHNQWSNKKFRAELRELLEAHRIAVEWKTKAKKYRELLRKCGMIMGRGEDHPEDIPAHIKEILEEQDQKIKRLERELLRRVGAMGLCSGPCNRIYEEDAVLPKADPNPEPAGICLKHPIDVGTDKYYSYWAKDQCPRCQEKPTNAGG